jgi:hypothetical protein
MSRQSLIAIYGAMLLGAATGACIASDEIRSGGRVDLILHEGHKPITFQTGYTYLDPLKQFTCKSANGCIVAIHGVLEFSNNGPELCSFVDGSPTFPACGSITAGGDITAQVPFVGSARVSQGTHTIQSAASTNNPGGTVNYWEMQYTVYEINHP